jgi:isoleucyl-tRNA synthetase
LEEGFKMLFQCVSLSYAARQNAKLKRRWPIKALIVVGPKKVLETLKSVEDLLVELANAKTVKFMQKPPKTAEGEWVSASEGDLQVLLDAHRDETLLGEGVMRDLARRVQALRKELGYMPTDVLDTVHVAGLDEETVRLLQPFLGQMEELVRMRKMVLHEKREDVETDWHECRMDDKEIYVAISESTSK